MANGPQIFVPEHNDFEVRADPEKMRIYVLQNGKAALDMPFDAAPPLCAGMMQAFEMLNATNTARVDAQKDLPFQSVRKIS